MTDFDYYTQFKFSQKEIDMLEYYIGTTPTDLSQAQETLNKVLEYNKLMNDLNRNRIPDKYKELNLTTKIQAYEKKLLEQTNIYYNKAKQSQTINRRCYNCKNRFTRNRSMENYY